MRLTKPKASHFSLYIAKTPSNPHPLMSIANLRHAVLKIETRRISFHSLLKHLQRQYRTFYRPARSRRSVSNKPDLHNLANLTHFCFYPHFVPLHRNPQTITHPYSITSQQHLYKSLDVPPPSPSPSSPCTPSPRGRPHPFVIN